MKRTLLSGTRLVADTVLGHLLLVAGLVMLATPGPGLVTVVAGLAVLGRHYRWASRLRTIVLRRIRDAGTAVRARMGRRRADGHVVPVEEPHVDRDAA
ncbi:PGPGW domain-containing protein [Egicoccus halophilus]|uniref:Transmembrane protein (PGPGW) n=1 Tax=Egicoccus halophilus TaxID=1670830 RepID=A0A8J3EWH7_9ACTN|nr:PGPGW domain-containing protein [Egicoccus halophilus]GGI03685.1 hypothetical protein GCM10011354_05270 [Egicoccus halophilus]